MNHLIVLEVNLDIAFLFLIHLPKGHLDTSPTFTGDASLDYGAGLGVAGEAKGKSMAGNFANKGAEDNHLTPEALAFG